MRSSCDNTSGIEEKGNRCMIAKLFCKISPKCLPSCKWYTSPCSKNLINAKRNHDGKENGYEIQ